MSLFCILAAGRGQRIQPLFGHLHKALLPVRGRPAIGYLLEKFPDDEFVIALGHQGESVKEFLLSAYPNFKLRFVDVLQHTGEGSGPGRSLLECEKFLNRPFFLFCVDSIFDEELPNNGNWIGVGVRDGNVQARNYCMVKESSKGLQYFDKSPIEIADAAPFCGIARIEDHEIFFAALKGGVSISGELQISSGLAGIGEKSFVHKISSWIDVGNVESFLSFEAAEKEVPFRKYDQAIYFIGNKVFKYSQDENEIIKKVKREKILQGIVPPIEKSGKNFYSYQFVDGVTLDEECNPELFGRFLNFCKERLWKKGEPKPKDWSVKVDRFYRERTIRRWNDIDQSQLSAASEIDNFLQKFDWDSLQRKGICSRFHGDLTLGNVIWTGSNFVLIDHRSDFSDDLEFGDRYYDYGKLLASLTSSFRGLSSTDWSPSPKLKEIKILKNFFEKESLDWFHVQSLLPIIFLNMACLSPEPARERLITLCLQFIRNPLAESICKGNDQITTY